MRRLRGVLEYDGGAFAGFQRQPGRLTVQSALESRLSELCDHPVAVTGAGRTDAGVHASGQVVHFDTTSSVPAGRLETAINSHAGGLLVLRRLEDAPEGFHARFGAVRRTYRYYVSRTWPSPFRARYVTYEPRLKAEGVEWIRTALQALLGQHDFAAFCAAGSAAATSVRTLYRAELQETEGLLRFELEADAFLQRMVRMIAGLALEIGRGKHPPEAMARALAERVRPNAQTAPAHGLFLVRVDYPDGYPPMRDERRPWLE